MSAKENFAQAFTGKKARLSALEFDLFQFLAALAFEFRSGKSCFARQFVDQLQQRLGVIAEAGKRNGTVVLAGVDGEIRAQPAKMLFNFATGVLRSSGAHHGRGHFGERGATRSGERVPGTEIQFAVKFWNSVRFKQDNLELVGKF